MNILAIDHGTKNIGLAWCNTEVRVVLPYGQVRSQKACPERQPNGSEVRSLGDLIEKENIDKVIVGLPVGLDGKENENTIRVKDFVNELKKEIAIPVEFVDERYTSAQADRMGGEASRDEKSAMIILQSYLDIKN